MPSQPLSAPYTSEGSVQCDPMSRVDTAAEHMDGWTDGWVDWLVSGWVDGRVHGGVGGWMSDE